MNRGGFGSTAAWLGALVIMALIALMVTSHFLGSDIDVFEEYDQEMTILMDEAADLPLQPRRSANVPEARSDNQQQHASTLTSWGNDVGPLDYLHDLEKRNLISPAGAADWRRSWLEVCISATSGDSRALALPSLTAGGKVEKLCNNVVPEGLDMTDVADVLAVSSELMNLAVKAASDEVIEELNQKRFSGDRLGHQQRAREVLADSLDLFRLRQVIKQLIQEGALQLTPNIESFFIEQPNSLDEISKDLATAWFCDRIGGCQGDDHPLVLRRCLEGGWQCFEADDLDHAIFQSTSAFKYVVFLVVYDALVRF